MKLNEILQALETVAPSELAEEWDNVGLLIDRDGEDVSKIMVCLDFTEAVLEQAIEKNCQMIVAHHPAIFKPIKRLDNPVLRKAVRHNICVYACHTNLDAACGGVNDVLAETLTLTKICADGILRVGQLEKPLCTDAFINFVCKQLCVPAVRATQANKEIQRVGVVGGAGGDFIALAAEHKCDAFVTGECSYHTAQFAEECGVLLICAGHYETEVPVVSALAKALSARCAAEVLEAKTENPFPVQAKHN